MGVQRIWRHRNKSHEQSKRLRFEQLEEKGAARSYVDERIRHWIR